MPTARLPRELAEQAVDTVNKHLLMGYRPKGATGTGKAALAASAAALGLDNRTFAARVERAKQLYGLEPDWSLAETPPAEPAFAPPGEDLDANALATLLRRSAHSLDDLASRLGTTRGRALDAIDLLRGRAVNIHEAGGKYSIESMLDLKIDHGHKHEYRSRPDGTYLFGFVSDTHLGSKYERLDCLNDIYDHFAAEGVDRVYHAGNWIDGEARFNKFDIKVHGMDAQCRYLAEHYPQRPGVVTYAVAGDDHEGWYAQREGVDIGKYAENWMRDAGRADWVDLGYMESFLPLIHSGTGAHHRMLVAHPGGGSAYAISYAIQKIVESYDGGEKPAVGLWGHYHKIWFGNVRNVWTIQTGCFQDQTPFARKKKLDYQVGGGIAKLTQDPETGAIARCAVEFFRYFNKGHYDGRWSLSGPVTLPERSA